MDPGTRATPFEPAQLTSEWLAAVLGEHGVDTADLTITGVETIGEGFLGTVARVTLSGAGLRSVVCKFAHPNPAVRAEIFGIGVYQRESRFYGELSAQLPLQTPTCWFRHTDAAATEHVLVLADLSEMTLVSQFDGCPSDRAIGVVDDLASLHRHGWGAEEFDALTRAADDEAWLTLVDGCIDGTLERTDLSEDLRQLTASYRSIGREVLARLARRPTVTHGDARIENVFFSDDGSRTWIDWDGIQIANGAAELAYFLSQSLRADVRRQHEAELIERYHRQLAVPDYPLEDCWHDYRLGLLAGWAVGMAAIDAYGDLEGAPAELVTEGIARVAAAIDDHQAMALVT